MCGYSSFPASIRLYRRRITRHRTWLECPKGRLFDLEDSQDSLRSLRGGIYTLHAAALVDPRCCTFVHTRTLPIVVAVSCRARVPTSGLGAVPKTDSFLCCGMECSGEYVSTITSTYVRNQRTAVFGNAPNQLVGTHASP
jgi:hypothetical protein